MERKIHLTELERLQYWGKEDIIKVTTFGSEQLVHLPGMKIDSGGK